MKLRYLAVGAGAVLLAWDLWSVVIDDGGQAALAATPACQAVAGGVCGSWDTPVAGGVDLDTYQQRAASDTPVIVWPQSAADPAEDFELISVGSATGSVYSTLCTTFAPVADLATATCMATADAVNIEYTPGGKLSGFCVSVITSTERAHAALRPCDVLSAASKTFNPYQTFVPVAATDADGSFTVFQNVLTGYVLNDARGGGAGSPVISYPLGSAGSTPNQLWEANG